jgi:hypothetical protein
LGIFGATLAKQGLWGGHFGRECKETAAKIAALQFLLERAWPIDSGILE